MDVTYLSDILKKVSDNSMDVDTALESLKHLPYEDIGYANIDQHRNLRTGEAEVIFGQSKTPEQIAEIRKSADLNTAVLDHVAAHIKAGMSTAQIDKLVYDFTTEHGGIPAPLGYEGFPKSVCTSINNQVCHGIPSEDIILEEGRKLYEVMDLGFGKCRMSVCGPESARELLHNNQLIRVATKYPNIAKDYFYNQKHQTVELIKLNGSIELAPIVGLSEVIVDIVETGSTLRENGLKVLKEVCPLSARMVVNQVSMKMEDERIRKLITELRNVVK